MSRVVVGVSGSLASLAALRAGAREARLGGRELVAVLAWSPPEGEGMFARFPDRAWAQLWEAEAAETLGRAFEEALGGDPAGVPQVRRRVLRGDPGRTLRAVAGLPDDLLVIGVRPGRRHGGKVGRELRAHAVCPVLAVPGPVLPGAWLRRLRRATAADFTADPAGGGAGRRTGGGAGPGALGGPGGRPRGGADLRRGPGAGSPS
ncbi:universal stress protein [Streptomyces sp. ISL-66]|uniref:universal stress protein n=1 Tax=Streptomyces sp. ISL-66 TaxID=2819186 RepID=UPI001BE999F9|nr:universal stress protein [Streptomyces sp. ISL-66]MBT2472168.1 universal stress protein [Streptomyces sp. ISL-66]